jgi:uncharacterized protein
VKIAVTGSTGFIGRYLVAFLADKGHEIVPVVRDNSLPGAYWDPESDFIDTAALAGTQAFVHLAGESVAERWNPDKKNKIYRSRIAGTRLLVRAMSSLQPRPTDFLCASAIGYYGERGAEILTEESAPGKNFLASVCVDWETAAAEAKLAGIRTTSLRFGIVLSTTGGAFPKMLAPFQIGAGGRLGSGSQYMSWIALSDTLRAIEFILFKPQLAGPINVVSPHPVTNIQFTQTLGDILEKPTVIQVPAAMAYLAYGSEMADEVLMASTRVVPERLSISGFQFQYNKLEPALRDIVTRGL